MLVASSLLGNRKKNSWSDFCCLLCRVIAAAGSACPEVSVEGAGAGAKLLPPPSPGPWGQPALLLGTDGRSRQLMAPSCPSSSSVTWSRCETSRASPARRWWVTAGAQGASCWQQRKTWWSGNIFLFTLYFLMPKWHGSGTWIISEVSSVHFVPPVSHPWFGNGVEHR